MTKRHYKDITIKALFAKSGNQCLFRDCCAPIIEDEDNIVTGEICHIEAESIKGPRFNPNLSEEERNGFDNLLLMCPRHHKIIDSNATKYTVEMLRNWKQKRESSISEQQLKATDEFERKIIIQSELFWNEIKNIDESDDTELKRKVENLSIKELLDVSKSEFIDLKELLNQLSKSDDKIMRDLKVLCLKIGHDFADYEKIFYIDNPFINRNWEIHSLGIPNCIKQIEMHYYQICILFLEELIKHNCDYESLLNNYREKLMEFQKNNYYYD